MNEYQIESQAPVELPKPQQQEVPHSSEATPIDGVTSEKEASRALEQSGSTPTTPHNQGHVSTQPVNPPPVQPDPVQGSGSSTQGLVADDVDLIEKEWVHKAKQIVEKTKTDPHEQNKEITLVKADYLKKRYNKDLKISEDT